MRKSTLAICISAALVTQGLLSPTASATSHLRSQAGLQTSTQVRVRTHAASLLYDQSGTAKNAAPSQNLESAYDAYDSAGADDFVVTDAAGWDISQFNFQVSFAANGGSLNSATYDINVYNDNGGVPGTLTSCTYSSLSASATNGDTLLSVALPAACHLDPGTYWVSEVANLDNVGGGQLFWSNASGPAINNNGAWENPGGGFGAGCTSWSDITTCIGTSTTTTTSGSTTTPSPVGGGNPNFLFQVIGSVTGGSGGSCDSNGICLDVTVAEDNGDPDQCGTNDSVGIIAGDAVNFCYTVTNYSGTELDYHSLKDNIDGSIFKSKNVPLADGASYQYNRTVNVPRDETVTSIWTAQDVPSGYSATPTTATPPITDRIFCDGFDGTPCDDGSGGGGFIDITSTGTALGLGDDDSALVSMPFSFNFFGQTSNNICINDNGAINFGVASCPFLSGANDELPSAGLGAAILPLWDDFDAVSGDIYTATVGRAPNRQFIVEWSNRVHYDGTSNTDGATFEVIFNEADGTIQFEYDDVDYTATDAYYPDPAVCDGGACATIGLQGDGATANQYSYMTASVSNGTGILWQPTSPQIFTDNDTVTLVVGAPLIDVAPNSLSGTTPAGGTSASTLYIGNLGNRPLNWNTAEALPALNFPRVPRDVTPVGSASNINTSVFAPMRAHKPMSKSNAQTGALSNLLAMGVPSFAENTDQSSASEFVSFDAAAPDTLNSIAAETERFDAGAFANEDFSTEYVIDGDGNLATVDTTTGATAVIGATGQANMRGLAWDSTTSTMYGTALVSGTQTGSTDLVTVDLVTGATTLVAPISGSIGASGYTYVFGLAVDPTGQMYGIETVSDALVAIDKTDASAANIGSLGFDAEYGQGLRFDPSTTPATLYLSSINFTTSVQNMYTVDTALGTATLIGPVGGNSLQLSAFAIAVAPTACSLPQDLPWVSVNPTSGTSAPLGASLVTVTYDATGLTSGDTKEGTICVFSNDTVTGTVAVPVEMTVGPANP